MPAEVVETIVSMRKSGAILRTIVEHLESIGVPTARGGTWQPAPSPLIIDAHNCGAYAA